MFFNKNSRTQCYCGEEPVGPISSEGDCDMECAGDSRFLCGGEWRNSVYHTSIPGLFYTP